jgi:hypothetical protein
MNSMAPSASLKEINTHKKKINWGDIPTIFHMVSTSLGDLDGILTNGFDNSYKRVLDSKNWNLSTFAGTKDATGKIFCHKKPPIFLRHVFNDMGYELHCYPVIDGEIIRHNISGDNNSPFIQWIPESMQMLFRINSLVAFSIYCYQNGDEADEALLKHAHCRVEQLITTLSKHFQITSVKGYSIAGFYQEIAKKGGDILSLDN